MADFDPNAPVQLLDPPAASPAATPGTGKALPQFDPTAPIDPDNQASSFDPNAPVSAEHPYVTKIQEDPTLTDSQKQMRVDAFNQGLAKYDPNADVSAAQRFGIHFKEGVSDTIPGLAVKALGDFTQQPFQAIPLPLRRVQGQLEDLQREQQRRTGALGDVMADPSYSEYPDSILSQQIANKQAWIQRFLTPEMKQSIQDAQDKIATNAAKSEGEKVSYQENLPPATGFAQKAAAVGGELAGGLTDPTNLLPLGDAAEGASMASRILHTGTELAGQTAALEPVRQTLAVAANKPDQVGLAPAAQRIAGGFVAGGALQLGSEAVKTLVQQFKGMTAADFAGLAPADAAEAIARKTGVDPATAKAAVDQVAPKQLPAPVSAATVEKPATASLSLNPEDRAITMDPDAIVQPDAGRDGGAAPVHQAFDPNGPVEQELAPAERQAAQVDAGQPANELNAAETAPAPRTGAPEGADYQYTVQRPEPHPAGVGEIPGYTQIDEIVNGENTRSSNLDALRKEGIDLPDVPDHLPTGQYTLDQIRKAGQFDPTLPVEPEETPQPAIEAPKSTGLISGSKAETWADAVIKKSQGQVNAGLDPNLFAAHVVKGAAIIERGITDFKNWSKEMLDRYGASIEPHLANLFRAARELHGEGDRVAGASPDDLKEFLADYRNVPPHRLIGEAADNPTPVNKTEAGLNALLRENGPSIRGAINKLAGESAPRTSALSQDSGNALVRYAAAAKAGPEVARAMAGDVLGSHLHDDAFAQKLGGVMVEDRLQAIKTGLFKEAMNQLRAGNETEARELFDHAQNVTSIVGKPDSPFASGDDYAAALADPEIKAAVQRHIDTVQAQAEKQHAQLGGRLAQKGIDTDSFVNLEALDKDGEPLSEAGGGTAKGDLTAPFKKGSRFNQQAYGTADRYELDYNKIADRMVTGNFEETAKRTMYDQLTQDGLGVVMPPGEKPPEINGRTPRKIQIDRRGLPAASGARTLVRNLYVDPRIYPEVIRAMNLDETFQSAAMQHMGNIVSWLQGPVIGAFHIKNLVSGIAGAPGGSSALADIARRSPGVNVVDALTRIGLQAVNVIKDSQEVRNVAADLARTGASRSPYEGAGLMGKFIHGADLAARLALANMHDNLVARGLAQDSEAGLREFINSRTGQYNSRLMGQISAKLKDLKVAPYIVAGQTFYRNGLRQVTGTPGVRAASTAAAISLRAIQMAGVATSLIVIPRTVNYLLSGNPDGPPGTRFGEIGFKTKDGKLITYDPQADSGLRRGLLETGADATISGIRSGESHGRIVDQAFKSAAGALVHPLAGPLVNAASTLATGYNTGGFKQAQTAKPGQSQIGQNAIAAAEQLNPLVGSSVEGVQRNGGAAGAVGGLAKPLLGMAGVKVQQAPPAEQTVRGLAGHYLDTLGIARDNSGIPSPYSPLTRAIQAQDFDHASSVLNDLVATKAQALPANLAEPTRQAIARREIVDYYDKSVRAPFTGSAQRERGFMATLDDAGQQAYAEARADRRQIAQTVRSIVYGRGK